VTECAVVAFTRLEDLLKTQLIEPVNALGLFLDPIEPKLYLGSFPVLRLFCVE